LKQIPIFVIGANNDDMVIFSGYSTSAVYKIIVSMLGCGIRRSISDQLPAQPGSGDQACYGTGLNDIFQNEITRHMEIDLRSNGGPITWSKLGKKA